MSKSKLQMFWEFFKIYLKSEVRFIGWIFGILVYYMKKAKRLREGYRDGLDGKPVTLPELDAWLDDLFKKE